MDVQFGKRLLEERLRLGLTQQQMADAGGVKKRAYCYYESGERIPSASFMSEIDDIGVDTTFLLLGIRDFESLGGDPSEQTLLSLFRGASKEDQGLIVSLALEVAAPRVTETLLKVGEAGKKMLQPRGDVEPQPSKSVSSEEQARLAEEELLLARFRTSSQPIREAALRVLLGGEVPATPKKEIKISAKSGSQAAGRDIVSSAAEPPIKRGRK